LFFIIISPTIEKTTTKKWAKKRPENTVTGKKSQENIEENHRQICA